MDRTARVTAVIVCFLLALGLAAGLRPSLAADAPPPAATGSVPAVEFVRDVQPILREHCYKCHGSARREGGVRWDQRAGALVKTDAGHDAIVPGKPAESMLIKAVRGLEVPKRMPLDAKPLSESQIATLERWIADGAVWPDGVDPKDEGPTWWAFRSPVKAAPPAVRDAKWVRNPIDNFILAKLEAEGVNPSPEADRHTLIRRVTLDLTGLPPTPAEIDAFVNDGRPDAYERLVDRLLASPRYGEHWARMWLDLARYADSKGLGSDPLRLYAWPFRDWLIDALNRNLPFDEFTIDVIAGDLRESPTSDQLLATSFHRNTMTNTEGGTDDEEWRVAAVKDRAITTSQVWTGLTLGCAQCHSHKYDPITQAEFYRFYAFFNQTADTDGNDDPPRVPILTSLQQKRIDTLQAEASELRRQLSAQSPKFAADMAAWEKSVRGGVEWVALDPSEMSSAGGATLRKLDDGSIRAEGANPERDTYTITARTSLRGITAIRIDALPDDTLAGKGPGRADNGNFVLSEVQLQASSTESRPARGRYVRVQLPGRQRVLHLAEVQVFAGAKNLAPMGKATASSTDFGGPPQLAIDGNTNGQFTAKSVQHNAVEDNPWWEVDLGDEREVTAIAIWNRTDSDLTARMNGAVVTLLDADRKVVFTQTLAQAPKVSVTLPVGGPQRFEFAAASADYEQPDSTAGNPYQGFRARAAIDGDAQGANWGWAIFPAVAQPHTAVFETARDIDFAGDAVLRLDLLHGYGARHTLGRFKLYAAAAPRPVRQLPGNIAALLAVAPDQRTEAQQATLIDYYLSIWPGSEAVNRRVAEVQQQIESIKATSVPIMRELPEKNRRTTHVMIKGNFLSPGETVEPGVPEAFGTIPEGFPANRLGLAHWLVSPENPLTSRVQVNRYWARIFGTGLCDSEEDFGTQGAKPSHPELLDYLAIDFREAGEGWDTKRLLKLIVTSATYRQSSRYRPELATKDPLNRLLARMPRTRLTAEQVRDQALAISGLLSDKIGGPSVYPPQPDGLWQAAFNGERSYPTSKGEDRYRRGLYTFWRRTTPHPSMATFDAPSREICALRRQPTNTPLQAFVTLNDPIYVEFAQALGRRIVAEGGATAAARARWALELATCRPADAEQVSVLVALYESELARYRQDRDAAMKMATDPLGALPAGADPAELAAWTVVANIVLNLDALMSRS